MEKNLKLQHTSASNLYRTAFEFIEIERWRDQDGYHLISWLSSEEIPEEKQCILSLEENLDDATMIRLSIEKILGDLHHNIIDYEFYIYKKYYSICNTYYDLRDCIIQIAKDVNGSITCVYLYLNEEDGYKFCISAFEEKMKDGDIISEFEDDLDEIIDTYIFEFEHHMKIQ